MVVNINKDKIETDEIIHELLYSREIEAYLNPFINNFDHIERGIEDQAHILNIIESMWTEYGFKDARTLKKEIANFMLKKSHPIMTNIINAIDRLSFKKDIDELSGGWRKTYLAEITGMAHLYAKKMNKPVAMIRLDFSNMGGTNNFFCKLLAAKRGVPVKEIDERDVFEYTDTAARIISKKIQEKLKELYPDKEYNLIRAGGDELQFLIPDLDPSEYNKLTNVIHETIEDFTAGAGLHSHENPKTVIDGKANILLGGFGGAVDIMDLREVNDYNDLANSDSNQKKSKKGQGFRRNNIARPFGTASYAFKYFAENPEKMPKGMDIDKIIKALIETEQDITTERYNKFKNLMIENGTDPDLVPKEELLDAITNYFNNIENEYKVAETNIECLLDDLHYLLDNGGVVTGLYQAPEIRYKNAIEQHLTDNGILFIRGARDNDINEYDEQLLEHVLSVLAPVDPVTKTPLDRDMPEITEIFMQDTHKAISKLLECDISDDYRYKRACDLIKKNNITEETIKETGPYSYRCVFHNLQGLNTLLGNDVANEVLRHFTDILKDEFTDESLSDDEDFYIAHYGAAEFQLLIKPLYQNNNDETDIVSKDLLNKITASINKRIVELNDVNIVDFLEEKGINTAQLRVSSNLKFGQVRDGKLRGWLDGMHFSAISSKLPAIHDNEECPRGGKIMFDEKTKLDNEVNLYRLAEEIKWINSINKELKQVEPKPT